jgi:hypothetical protein
MLPTTHGNVEHDDHSKIGHRRRPAHTIEHGITLVSLLSFKRFPRGIFFHEDAFF